VPAPTGFFSLLLVDRDMDIGLVGDGPAVDAVETALGDVDVNVMPVEPALLDGFDLAVVVGTTGSEAFEIANDRLDRWVAIEVGGLGGAPIEGVDAAITVFDDACYDCLRTRVAAGSAEPAEAPRGTRSAVRYAGAVAGRRTIRLLAGDPVGDTVHEVPGPERTLIPVPGCGCGPEPGDALPLGETNGNADGATGSGSRSLDDALDRAERAVDPRIGLLSEVGERESFPIPYYVSRVADTTGFSDAQAPEFAGGADDDWDAAFMKALGEGLERYAAGVYRSASFTTGPASEVPNPVTPDAFVRPDSAAAYDADDTLPWTTGERLTSSEGNGGGDLVSLPAEFVAFPPPENRYRAAITTGLGLGNSGPEAALVRAVRGHRARRDDDDVVLDDGPVGDRDRRPDVRPAREARASGVVDGHAAARHDRHRRSGRRRRGPPRRGVAPVRGRVGRGPRPRCGRAKRAR